MIGFESLIAPDYYALLQGDYRALQARVEAAYAQEEVFPPRNELFTALRLTPVENVRVVIIGQDPYHDVSQAHGLAFSVRNGCQRPPSLMNIFKELQSDLQQHIQDAYSDLSPWARQGILLLNTSLTVRAHTPGSHARMGWETFTGEIITRLLERPNPILFILWGRHAQQFLSLIQSAPQHQAFCSAHPSPLSASRGFFKSRPFSRINAFLEQNHYAPINWDIACVEPKTVEAVNLPPQDPVQGEFEF